MNQKKKIRIQEFVFGMINGTCFAICGGFIGFFGARLQILSSMEKNSISIIMMMVLSGIILFVLYFLAICVHEVGHMIFGLMSGYTFGSIRFGKLMISKENGKLKLSRYSLPGTGGQCIMEPPAMDHPEDMPVFLYNMGGLFANIILCLISGILVYCLKDTSELFTLLLAGNALIHLTCLITNGIPFSEIGNDGSNTMILCRNKKARVAFCKSLKVVELISKGIGMTEMPKELLEFDQSDALDNSITTAQAVTWFNYLINTNQYQEAKEIGEYILEKSSSINRIHAGIINAEMMFIASVIDHDLPKANEIFKENKKSFQSLRSFISIQRCLYAYYALVNVDEKLKEKYKQLFLKSVKSYPYKVDAESEQKLFDLIEECL